MKAKASCLVLLCILGACSSDVPGDAAATDGDAPRMTAQVTGTLMYRERIALPPGAIAEAWLLDTSRADVPAVEIANQKIEDPRSPPIPFVLEYDPQDIREGMQYGVRATISVDGELLFTSDTHYPVLTRGAGDKAAVMLIMVDRDK